MVNIFIDYQSAALVIISYTRTRKAFRQRCFNFTRFWLLCTLLLQISTLANLLARVLCIVLLGVLFKCLHSLVENNRKEGIINFLLLKCQHSFKIYYLLVLLLLTLLFGELLK